MSVHCCPSLSSALSFAAHCWFSHWSICWAGVPLKPMLAKICEGIADGLRQLSGQVWTWLLHASAVSCQQCLVHLQQHVYSVCKQLQRYTHLLHAYELRACVRAASASTSKLHALAAGCPGRVQVRRHASAGAARCRIPCALEFVQAKLQDPQQQGCIIKLTSVSCQQERLHLGLQHTVLGSKLSSQTASLLQKARTCLSLPNTHAAGAPAGGRHCVCVLAQLRGQKQQLPRCCRANPRRGCRRAFPHWA